MEGYWTIGLVLDFLLVTKFLLTFLEFLLVVLTSSGAGIISGGAGITLVESLILHKVNNISRQLLCFKKYFEVVAYSTPG